jgi:hypothetical protein
MANPAESEVQNLLPVQAFFDAQGNFQTFIGQNKPFYATANPDQSGLNITNSTINSSVIGGVTPAAASFTTATVLTQPVGATDVVNLLALQSYAAGISWKQPCVCATLANITLSGLQTIDGHAVVAGDRVLVKDQSTAANNGIYLASASAWTRSLDANSWDELICAISFIEYGTQAGGAWFCTAQDGGTLGVTAVNWSQFTTSATYSAGTGLTLTGQVFSITPVGTASTYGSASTVPVFTTNASGQVSAVTNTNIAIGATQITSGTIDSARISGAYSGITGVGTLLDLTVTNTITGSINGNAATATTAGSATTATTAINIAGGASGSLPYQTASGTTGFLSAGTNGQILALASGVPSWIDNQVGTVTSVSGTGTVSGISLSGTVTSSGSLTLGGSLDLSAPPAIGGTTPNSGAFTTLTSTNDATIHGLIVGKGGGSVSNNTVLGVTALDSNTTGQQNVAIGINALTTATTANNQTAVGYQALRLSTASDNTAVGSTALQSNSTGGGNVAMGFQTLTANTTGGSNTAIGRHALITNSTGSNLTALGNHAGAYETGSNALYIDAYDRTNTAGDKAGALLYGTFNATPSSQTLTINGQVTLPYQLNLNAAIALTGSAGSSGQVLTSAGAGATPTWTTPTTGITITDDTTTNATRYLAFTSATSGSITGQNVASTKLQFNPSTGILTATGFSGSLASATGLPISTGVSGLGSGVATFLATPSSANLASAVSDETGTGSLVFANTPTLVTPVLGTPTSGNLNNCTADGTNKVGYRTVPPVGTKTSSYTLALADVGEYVQVGSGGSITIPNSTFAEGDVISIFNNTTGGITITCSITTAYIAGTDSDKATMTLATRGVATILFISSTVCVVTGNVS